MAMMGHSARQVRRKAVLLASPHRPPTRPSSRAMVVLSPTNAAFVAGEVGIIRSWYTADALGSVRVISSNAGIASAVASYDPYGGLQGSAIVTGELQQGSNVYLRARWYNATNSTFTSRDPWMGDPQRPNTLAPYLYAAANSVLLTDPSGRCYEPIEFLRDIEPENCSNLDAALRISQHPNANVQDRLAANTYIVAWAFGHSAALVGGGILAGQAAVGGSAFLTAVTQWGASHVVASGAVPALQAGAAAVGAAGTGITAYQAWQGDQMAQAMLACPGAFGAATMWNEAAELGAAMLARANGRSFRQLAFAKAQGGGWLKLPRRIINQTTAERYYIHDSENPRLMVFGTVDENGMLSIDMRTVLENGERTPLFNGSEQFHKVIRFFHRRMIGIKANWQYGTNLDKFNANLRSGMSYEDAARNTWTGERATEAGFDRVSLDPRTFEGAFGQYTHVKVNFTR
jgi:RHS repeat-associated protein